MRCRPVIALTLFACLAACAGPAVRPPEGITVVREEEPTPPASAIAAAQRRLQEEQLYVGPITGALTPAVRVALAHLQRLRELPVTGTLNAETAAALGLGNLADFPADVEVALDQAERPAPEGPSAAEILQMEEVEERPQPPPGALAEARGAAARLLAQGTSTAGMEVGRAGQALPGEAFAGLQRPAGEVRAADSGEEQRAGVESLRAAEQAADRAQGALASARREAFALLLEARLAGGYALLPVELIVSLEDALQARSLLLRGQDRKLGPDDQAAIRWVKRSVGLEATGLPSLPLLEALGIDPSPMFRED